MNKITGRKLRISENRKDRIPVIKVVILCGLQELSLRGQRDQGTLDLEPPMRMMALCKPFYAIVGLYMQVTKHSRNMYNLWVARFILKLSNTK